MTSFASDNNSAVLPQVMDALVAANTGHATAYGYDNLTLQAEAMLQGIFGPRSHAYLVWSGSGANVLALKTCVRSWQAVVCSAVAHIATDETGAPEAALGAKLITVPSADGKLTPETVLPYIFGGKGIEHRSQPRVLSITQPTEYGVLYTPDEVKTLAELAHANDMLLHMDGARIANAAAALGVPVADFTTHAGVDILSFGGTKNGLMGAEAVVILNPELAPDFRYIRKQGLQLASKHRYLAAQMVAYLTDDLWLKAAAHANAMAARCHQQLQGIAGLAITQPVQTNAIFARLPVRALNALMKDYYFYIWDPMTDEVRWMFCWDTPAEAADGFAERILAETKRALGG